MTYLLCSIILVLAVLNYLQFKAKKETNNNLRYITDKLESILSEKSSERILLVTKQKELKKVLNEVNRLLSYNHEMIAEGSRLKISMNRMLSNISHDLKTPLTVVLGYIETIWHDQSLASDEQNDLLLKVQVKAKDVLDLINKFFDLAKIESHDWQMNRKTIHINEVCRKVMLGYYDILTKKSFNVMIDIPEVPIYINADEDALFRILDNLLSNAIKYGNDGKIVGLALRHDDNSIFIDVWDKGKGIRKTEQSRIFERLYTLEDSRNSSIEGSGLGLSIAKQLTEQMNGYIDLSSIPYEKTVFTVTFPRLNYDSL
jgi:signal transduction histidine kinase